MTTSTSMAPVETLTSHRSAAWAALTSGMLGFIAFGLLMTYLFTAPTEVLESKVVDSDAIPFVTKLLLRVSDVGFILQALFIAPAVIVLHIFGRARSPRLSQATMMMGVISLCSIALLRSLALLFPERVSGILFIVPTAFVGVWLIIVNMFLAPPLPKWLRTVGGLAGIGFVVQGASFFFLGGLKVLTEGPLAYADNVDFHTWNAIGGVPGGIFYSIWAILLGRGFLANRERWRAI